MTRHVYLRLPWHTTCSWRAARKKKKRQEIQSLVVPQNAIAVTVIVTQFVTDCPHLVPAGLQFRYIGTRLMYITMCKNDHLASTMLCLSIILL